MKLFHKIFGWFGGDGSHHLRLCAEKAQEVCSPSSALSDHHVCEKIILDSLEMGTTAVLCSALRLREGAII